MADERARCARSDGCAPETAMFNGNSRFRLVRKLGSGGMGVVYEAEDQLRKARVALKTLYQTDADLLYRLKREFRSLRDVVHRNLISLDELFEEDGNWFFTMELIDGENLSDYLQRTAMPPLAAEGGGAPAWRMPGLPDEAATETIDGRVAPAAVPTPPAPREVRSAQPLDFDRIRAVFAQTAEGLLAIHDAGKIHRDIKPSNVLVTKDGRVVILDFGLVTERWDMARSHEREIVGTVMYMAPEQAAGTAVGPQADWYSLGVMLYEAVAGQRPFDGPFGVVLAAKQYSAPRNPLAINSHCPDDLAQLCMQLLRVDPLQRPSGLDVLRQLGAGKPEAAAAHSSPAGASQRGIFVGREPELRELHRAFDDVRGGAAVAVFVHGESGIGKSTLIHHFITTVNSDGAELVVLMGQCREHEAVPFKAMDGIIDALSRFLCRLSEVAAAELVPHNAALLPGAFPVLGRIPAIAKAPRPVQIAADPFRQRKRVFGALREMLCLLTERYRLICVIDDMQWADSDSLTLLEELLRPPDEPRLLFLASLRSEDEAPPLPPLPVEVRRVRLERLNPQESVTLAGLLLDRVAPEQKLQTTRIVDETAGHPLFIGELVRYAAADHQAAIRQLRLDEAIWARVSQLQPAALDVLKILAVAVAPLSEELIYAAARLEPSDFQKSVAMLRVSHLVRSSASAHTSLEVYHDRVRQAVIRHLEEPERVALNQRCAIALETSSAAIPPELLIYHLEGAREFDKAARKAVEAADRAQAGLAFEQAARLYEAALRLARWSDDENRQILIKLGDALASAGRGPEAADAYGKAAVGADPSTQLTCRIQVADQLVQSGRLESGASLLFSLFEEHGHAVPRSQMQITLRIAWYRLRLALHGLRWTDRPKHEIQPRELALLALYKAASRGLTLVDPVRAAYFVIRGLNLSMAIGDRDSVMYFILLEAGLRGSEDGKRHAAFLKRADAVMGEHPDPAFQTSYRVSLGGRTYVSMDREFKRAFEMLDRSEQELSQTANAAWELSAGRFFLIHSLRKMGDFARMKTYSRRFIREAEQRGNVYGRTTLSRLCNILWLVDDDPRGAREELKKHSWIPYSEGYHSQHWLELNALVEIAIYEGSSVEDDFFVQHIRGLKKSFLGRVLGYRCDAAWLVGRRALSELARDPSQGRVVRRSIANLLSYNTQYSRVLAGMLRATLAANGGDTDSAIAQFRDVLALAELTHVFFIASVARRRLGLLIGGDEGGELVTAAERWMRDAGIRDMERMTTLVSPVSLRTSAYLVTRPERLLPSKAQL
jgi:serine/threonine protein kinase